MLLSGADKRIALLVEEEDSSPTSERASSDPLFSTPNCLPEMASAERLVPLTRASVSKGTALRVTAFNAMCTALGAGMLAIPHTVADVGVAPAAALFVLLPLVLERTSRFTTLCADASDRALLADIAEAAGGPWAGLLCACVVTAYNLGTTVGYILIAGQLLPETLMWVLGLHHLPGKAPCIALVWAIALVPLSSLPSTSHLKFASMAAIVLEAFVVAAIVYAGVVALTSAAGGSTGTHMSVNWASTDAWAYLRALPTCTFAFLFHANVPFMYAELRRGGDEARQSKYESKVDKFATAIRAALGIISTLYLTAGILGYAAFGESTSTNIMQSLSTARGHTLVPDLVVQCIQAAMCLVMILSVPMTVYGVRIGMHAALFTGQAETPLRRWLGALLITAPAAAAASALDNLGTVIGVLGATAGAFLAFLSPCAFMLLLASSVPAANRPSRLECGAILLLGVVVMVCGTAATLQDV